MTKVMISLPTSLLIFLAIEQMDMGRDVTAFRKRFEDYKNGKSISEIYDAGLPKYAGGTPGQVNPYTLPLLQEFEGFKDSVYLDGKGIPTIGWGFTDSSLVNKGKISRKEADAELQRLAGNVESDLISKLGIDNWKQMSPESQAALISYAYNYPAGFKDTTNFMKLWRAGKYWDAIDEVDAGMHDKANPGLKKRRLKEQSYLRKDPFFLATSSAPTKKTDAELKIPIINKTDATTINKVIPQEQTHTTWEGAQYVSPYLTGKPMLRPIHRVQLPNLIDVIEDDQWEPEFKLPGMKNGKLPKYGDGDTPSVTTALLKGGASLLPGVGTAIDAYDLYKEPSLDNLGYLLLSGIGDAAMFTGFGGPFGLTLKNIRNVAKLNKARKTAKALSETRKAGDAVQLYQAKKAYNQSKAAATALAAETGNIVDTTNEMLQGFSNGKSPIHIKPANRGKLTRLKARTGKSESELYNDGNPAHKKMVVFARNARKWKH